MSYENVYYADSHQENLDMVSMYKMREAADVVIEEDSNGAYNITKPTDGYNGLTVVDSPLLFAQSNPQASVLFLRYAGGFTRWNYTGETIPVSVAAIRMGKGSTVQVNSMFYTRSTNTYELNVSGINALVGTVDSSLFGEDYNKCAELILPQIVPVGTSVITQINPALADFSTDSTISLTEKGWTKRRSYTLEAADDLSVLIPGSPSDVIVKIQHNGVTTTYIIHCNVSYVNTEIAKASAAALGELTTHDPVLVL